MAKFDDPLQSEDLLLLLLLLCSPNEKPNFYFFDILSCRKFAGNREFPACIKIFSSFQINLLLQVVLVALGSK